ncbi:MAG TPA: T9SS type A sorting domain-containing protein [Flavobacteriales bacterium]|nr:T9SS type A sorting domain-containing protein [Flavobacteriales bacterium]
MTDKKSIFFTVLLLLCSACQALHAQEATPAAGGVAAGKGGKASYTIGQTFYTTSTGNTGSTSEGLQQVYVISNITGFNAPGINLKASIYPNPTNDYLILQIDKFDNELSYTLFDINGKSLANNKVSATSTKIPMSIYAKGTYFLKVASKNNELKSFKIIKN